jgi:hypothetical protein
MSSSVNNLITLIKTQFEVDLIPVAIGAFQILQKSPNLLGAEAAEAYILGNAPAALLSGATTLLQQEIAALTAKLTAFQAAQSAPATPAVSGAQVTAKSP